MNPKFVSSTPSHLRAILDGRHRLDTSAYMVLIADGVPLDQGLVTALVCPRALAVVFGAADAAMGGQSVASPTIDHEVVLHG